MFIDREKTDHLRSFLEQEHFRYMRKPEITLGKDEVDLGSDLAVEVAASPSPLLEQMERDFRRFLDVCMGFTFASPDRARYKVRFVLDGTAQEPLSRDESFSISVGDDVTVVSARSERGLLHGAHHIEKQFAFRSAPFLRKGMVDRSPLFTPRISQTVFTAPDGSINDPKMLTDEYMSLMSHFGVNGIHIYMRLWDYCLNSQLPELNTPDYEENTGRLSELCRRAAKYGLDIYVVVRTEFFPEDAPVFAAHPEARGAAINFPLPSTRYGLCSSSPDVLECYREAFSNLLERIPTLGGVILIVGGEGFIHCFTRPKPPLSGGTSCAHCSGKDPSEVVANVVNTIGDAVKSASPRAMVFAWPYSAFTWLGSSINSDRKFIERLNDNISLLSNFETPYRFVLGEQSAMLIDYNIVNIGPSEQFQAQTDVLEGKGAPHYAKMEATTEPGWFFLPYLPLHYRWADRVRSMREHKVAGYVCQWRFYGFNGSLPEEIFAEMSWDERLQADDLLLKIARRDFGAVSERILDGWKILSDVWPKIPSSHLLFGEREFYMKGPIYLGPAHPLILDVQKRYGLGWKFFTLRGDTAESLAGEELAELEKNAPPRYSSDLLFTHPFGAEAVEQAFDSVLREWDSGVSIIEEAVGDNPTTRSEMELDVCRTIGIHLRSVRNVIRFYRIRDSFFASSGTADTLGETMVSLAGVLEDEIGNAESALAILERDARIGYGHSYGQVYDAQMVREKIGQCRYVRGVELPELISGMEFHLYQSYNP